MALIKMLRPTEVLCLTGPEGLMIKIGITELFSDKALLDINAPDEVLISAEHRDKVWVSARVYRRRKQAGFTG